MQEVILTSSLLTLVMAMIAGALLWVALRFLDYLVGFNFGDWINRAKRANHIAVAVYLGARFVGACLLVGLLFS